MDGDTAGPISATPAADDGRERDDVTSESTTIDGGPIAADGGSDKDDGIGSSVAQEAIDGSSDQNDDNDDDSSFVEVQGAASGSGESSVKEEDDGGVNDDNDDDSLVEVGSIASNSSTTNNEDGGSSSSSMAAAGAEDESSGNENSGINNKAVDADNMFLRWARGEHEVEEEAQEDVEDEAVTESSGSDGVAAAADDDGSSNRRSPSDDDRSGPMVEAESETDEVEAVSAPQAITNQEEEEGGGGVRQEQQPVQHVSANTFALWASGAAAGGGGDDEAEEGGSVGSMGDDKDHTKVVRDSTEAAQTANHEEEEEEQTGLQEQKQQAVQHVSANTFALWASGAAAGAGGSSGSGDAEEEEGGSVGIDNDSNENNSKVVRDSAEATQAANDNGEPRKDDQGAAGTEAIHPSSRGVDGDTSMSPSSSKVSPARPGSIGMFDRAVTLPATKADLERSVAGGGVGDPDHPLKKQQQQQPSKDTQQQRLGRNQQLEQQEAGFPRPPFYSELVCLPRPLFFASSLPPRVIEEAKKAVLNPSESPTVGAAGTVRTPTKRPPSASSSSSPSSSPSLPANESARRDETGADAEQPQSFVPLRPEYRNLEGAILAYGRGAGADVFSSASAGSKISTNAQRSSAYVTTYQPVWGDAARKDRAYRREAAAAIAKEAEVNDSDVKVIDLCAEQSSLTEAVTPAALRAEKGPRIQKGLGSGEVSGAAALRARKAQSVKKIVDAKAKAAATTPSKEAGITSEEQLSQQQENGESSLAAVVVDSSVASPADNLFLQWARGGSDGAVVSDSQGVPPAAEGLAAGATENDKRSISPASSNPAPVTADNDFLKWARGDRGPSNDRTFVAPKKKADDNDATAKKHRVQTTLTLPPPVDDALPSDQRQFLQWARGEKVADESIDLGAGTFVGDSSALKSAQVAAKDIDPVSATDTFRPMARSELHLEDSDSFEGSELKKQVGLNDNLSAALASLGQDEGGGAGGRTESMAAAEAGAAALLAADSLVLTTKDGRLKTNLELTGGREPLYGCDDTPLPIEADLGVFETKEDQVKSAERRKNQEIIQSIAVPNIFGSLACPSTCTSPDDTQSWNSRNVVRQNASNATGSPSVGFAGPLLEGTNVASPSSAAGHRRSRTTSSGVKVQAHRNSLSGVSQGSVKSAPIPGKSCSRDTASTSSQSQQKKHPPPPPPPITTDPTFLRNQRGAYPGAGGGNSSRLTSNTEPSSTTSSGRGPSRRRQQQREASGKNLRVGWWTMQADDERARNKDKSEDKTKTGSSPAAVVEASQAQDKSSLQLPPDDDAPRHYPETGLSPSPLELRRQNRTMADLHPATSAARVLPFLSDRPPGTRYLQIDAKAVEFSSVGEIEPLFCTMAIWHVETATGTGGTEAVQSSSSSATSSQASSFPVPNLRRCGRITEALYFDVVTDPEVQDRCASALWPRAGGNQEDGVGGWTAVNLGASPRSSSKKFSSSKTFKDGIPVNLPESDRLSGTRCGVFPLPSNFSISNLYAVLIVHKVLADDSEVEVYLKRERESKPSTPKQISSDLSKLRSKAERSSERLGRFVMPFAFGVAPLLQVIGAEIPRIPSSRAVQIPLFRLDGGRGEKPIIDHIMVMLHPRAEFSGSGTKPAELTKGGSAMLVMRNFGYLGLQSVVNVKSSLARDRLVDFSGDFQLRRKKPSNESGKEDDQKVDDDGGRVCVAPQWQPDFVAEPTENGGRNVTRPGNSGDSVSAKRGIRNSPRRRAAGAPLSLYSQELAPIPLSFTPPSGRSGSKLSASSSSSSYGEDAEVSFYTAFCNELVCQPRLLHNCLKRNIVVKVEVRELKWSEWIKSYVALLPRSGPSIHNSRRGPFLVDEAYTSCAYHTLNPVFLDDFKIKLPFVLEDHDAPKSSVRGRLVLLFSVLNVAVKGKKKWTDRLLRQSKKGSQLAQGDSADADADDEIDKNNSGSSVQQLGCGVLPLSVSSDSNVPCLIPNGLHDVKIQYLSRAAPSSLDIASLGKSLSKPSSPDESRWGGDNNGSATQGMYPTLVSGKVLYPSGALILDPIKSVAANKGSDLQQSISSDTESIHATDESRNASTGDGESSIEGHDGLLTSPRSEKSATAATATPVSTSSLSSIARDMASSPKQSETMILQVRTVSLSSVHPQNATLSKFFNMSSKYPRCVTAQEMSSPTSPWSLPRNDILLRVDTDRGSEAISASSQALAQSIVELSKSSLCPQVDLSSHLLRVLPQLWRALVVGEGIPELLWANPASLIALRLHSFATLLYSLSSATVYLAKNGLTQLDGRGKWNLVSMAFVVGMIFDEEDLFLLPDGCPIENLDDILSYAQRREKFTTNDADAAAGPGPSANESFASLLPQGAALGDDGLVEEGSSRRMRKQLNKDTTKKVHAVSGHLAETLEPHLSPIAENANQETTKSTSTSTDASRRIDSKADFQAALQRANSADDEVHSPLDGFSSRDSASGASVSGSRVAQNMISAFGTSNGPAGTRRRWMTAPSSALATIQEDSDVDERKEGDGNKGTGADVFTPSLGLGHLGRLSSSNERKFGNEAFVDKAKRSGTKQMRVPRTQKHRSVDSSSTLPANYAGKITEQEATGNASGDADSEQGGKALVSDDDIEAKGTQFLDAIGKSLGFSGGMRDMGGEERRVGIAHHRKTRSRCSIDWTLPPTDFGNLATLAADSDQVGDQFNSPSAANKSLHPFQKGSPSKESAGDELAPKTLPQEPYIELPGFIDRLVILGEKGKQGRWFPYAYEVVIFQWFALLVEQTRSIDQQARDASLESGSQSSASAGDGTNKFSYRPGSAATDPATEKSLKEAALKARGVTIACAPILFEIIKKSLGWRIDSIFRVGQRTSTKQTVVSDGLPLVTLDSTILSTLEELISMVTDACIDSRNFDSWQFRQTAIDVNDAIIRFLRDLFAFLEPKSVHRLVLVYFSRFVMKEGKHWQDRDSKIGLRCSWETCKLRLNAVALFARLPDFHDINMPLMNSWGSWLTSAPEQSTIRFFDQAIEQLEGFDMAGYAGGEGPVRNSSISLPKLQPHWLVELVTEICLSATGHAEQNIQHRASSLLHELFWAHSQRCKANGTLSVAASMYVPFVIKVLGQINYLSSLPAKNQLRKDILPCVIFVLQSAPVGLMRALWRKLCRSAEGKGKAEKYGGLGNFGFGFDNSRSSSADSLHEDYFGGTYEEETDASSPPSIFDMFSLLNLALKTLEYEGSESSLTEEESGDNIGDQLSTWKREFLLAIEQENYAKLPARPRPYPGLRSTKKEDKEEKIVQYTTSSSRKWFSHDASIVITNTCRYIVREALGMLKSYTNSEEGTEDTHRSVQEKDDVAAVGYQFQSQRKTNSGPASTAKDDTSGSDLYEPLNFSVTDTVIFVRGTSSVYLHTLCLRESDVVIIKTLIASVEIVKIFGIKVFLAAVGETLQHWMRIVLAHCGARRAEVRVQALEFLALILRLTWDSYGSFLRIRLPMLAVQTEVMERIVATAATRYYREQRRLGTTVQYLTNESAEASLSPLWRTLDRLHHQSASQNIAFRSALMRLAEMMKKLFRAYIAAHALAIMNRLKSSTSPITNTKGLLEDNPENAQQPAYIHNSLVSVHRILANSAGFSKQFLGLQGSSSSNDVVTHNEAIEDAFLEAADVFSPTELPSHRVAWLRKLAEFHSSRDKFAEEATCHFHIHYTLRQAAKLHESLWTSVPFLPWASDSSDGVHLEGDGPASGDIYDADYDSSEELSIDEYPEAEADGKHIEKNQSFRRIFYRVANSVRMRTGDWDVGGNKTLFYGVTFASEYDATSPWITLREMEEDMVEEAETSGDLYLKAGIVESSRFAWSLATQFYSETYNYARLAHVYRRLALVVESQVPIVDTSNQLELSSPLGRFYRVWFHGGAPDELMGAEFVYRTAATVKLEKFGRALCSVLKCVLPEKTPIDLVLDDGRPDESAQKRHNQRRGLGAAPREAIKIKVTPLRPLLKRESTFRGTPEWFYKQTDYSGFSARSSSQSYQGANGGRRSASADEGTFHMRLSPRHRSYGSRSVSDMSAGMSSNASFSGRLESGEVAGSSSIFGASRSDLEGDLSVMGGGTIVGVDKFSFTQPIKKDRVRGSRDWLTSPVGDFAEKTLRVTQITVEKCFPSCVSRQSVVHRAVFTQSPVEAGVEAVCSWCAVLFRTAVATNGLSVIGTSTGQGIGTAAAKVVADCIHCSRVKELGQALLSRTGLMMDDDENSDVMLQYMKLSPAEISRYQVKLARSIIMFLELLHLLIARNRDLLLEVVQARKRSMRGSSSLGSTSGRGVFRRGAGGLVSSPESVGRYNNQGASTTRSMYSSSNHHHEQRPSVGNANDVPPGGSSKHHHDDGSAQMTGAGSVTSGGPSDRTDSAIAVQSELQRAFISMAKVLYPLLSATVHSETPRWLKLCAQENYFSSGTYRQTRIAMGEDLFFFGGSVQPTVRHAPEEYREDKPEPYGVPISIVPSRSEGATPDGSYAGSVASRHSRASRGSEQRLRHHHQAHRSSPSHSSRGAGALHEC